MPIKRTLCHICNTEVNKAQTYALGDGNRACKVHEGVTQKRDQLEQSRRETQQKNLQRAVDRERRQADSFYNRQFSEGSISLKPRCWVCKNTGQRSDEFFLRYSIERAKSEKIFGLCNPFDPKHPGNQIKMSERCIFVLSIDVAKNALKYIHGDFGDLARMVKALAVCGPCCQTLKIDPMPKIEIDELLRFAAFSETWIQPVINAVAETEMARDN